MDGRDIALGLIAMAIMGTCSLWIAMSIARVVARQRIAENLLRERLARTWGRVQPAAPAYSEAK
jgi:uncharacterized membrane protein SpoIIM required for sporulation